MSRQHQAAVYVRGKTVADLRERSSAAPAANPVGGPSFSPDRAVSAAREPPRPGLPSFRRLPNPFRAISQCLSDSMGSKPACWSVQRSAAGQPGRTSGSSDPSAGQSGWPEFAETARPRASGPSAPVAGTDRSGRDLRADSNRKSVPSSTGCVRAAAGAWESH